VDCEHPPGVEAGGEGDLGVDHTDKREAVKLALVTALWVALARGLEPLGERTIPDAWKAKLQYQTFLMMCQVTAAAVGVGLCSLLCASWRQALGWARPRARGLALTAMVAPAALVVSTVIALQIAMPTLLAELQTQGAGASRQNAGEFGRMLGGAPLLATLLWGAVLAAVTEELLFRGALWSLLQRVVRFFVPPPSAGEGVSKLGPLLAGLLPTIGSAAIFAALHANLSGGVGIVRVVSSSLLGLFCGLLRWSTGSIAAPVLLHLLNNALVIGVGRRWFATSHEPIFEGVPDTLAQIAALGLLTAAALGVGLWAREHRAARERAMSAEM